ncbi:MAG TPA: DUF1634 domain-containing protein [Ktedonobacterales bacterium]|nr:DUF1634 domain-containing protein [Ktedonobacterales bacterium]
MAEENTGATAATAEPDQRLRQAELVISHVLRGGVVVSAAIILIGAVWFYLQMAIAGHAALGYPHTFGGIIRRLFHGEPLAMVALGLLILLLTPILRVAISIVVFALEHDWLYTVITITVLIILLVSLLLGRGGA